MNADEKAALRKYLETLEPLATNLPEEIVGSSGAIPLGVTSMATSLKRIADALEGIQGSIIALEQVISTRI